MLIRSSYSIVGLSLLLGLVACSERPPEEKIEMARARYEAELSAFAVLQQPLEAPEVVEETGAEPADEVDGGDSGEEAWEESVDLRQDVLLDIVIRQDSLGDRLPGITLDITMADGDREIQVWRVWFDTTNVEKGPGVQYSHTLEDVDYQPGFGFSAEVRTPVPPEERSQYREFDSAGE